MMKTGSDVLKTLVGLLLLGVVACGKGQSAEVIQKAPPSACQPISCSDAGFNCGLVSDGCGDILDCGSCQNDQTCGANGLANVCGEGTCNTLKTCADYPDACGLFSDGCSSVISCTGCSQGGQTLTVSSFCLSYSELTCKQNLSCGATELAISECVRFTLKSCVTRAGFGQADSMVLDPSKAEECLQAARNSPPCSTPVGSLPQCIFRDVLFFPHAVEGSACGNPDDCGNQANLTCAGSGCSNTCTAFGQLNQICSPKGTCAERSLGCDNGTGTCRVAGELGGPCLQSHCLGPNVACSPNTNTCVAAGKLGQPCASNQTCDAGLFCHLGTKTCAVPGTGTEGTECYVPDKICGPGFACLFIDGKDRCHALPAPGKPCLNNKCRADAYCSIPLLPTTANPICYSRRPLGTSCSYTYECEANTYCSSATYVCVASKTVGNYCDAKSICREDLLCLNNTCVAPRKEGEFCALDADCVDGLRCDGVIKTCQKSEYARLTEACTSSPSPYSNSGALKICGEFGVTCKGVIAPTFNSGGKAGTCQTTQSGDACDTLAQCPENHSCEKASGAVGVCKPVGTGSACLNNWSVCPNTHYCDLTESKCKDRLAKGAPCEVGSDTCAASLFCDPTKTCQPVIRNLGEICGGGAQCTAGLECFADLDAGGSKTCHLPREIGDKCERSSDCSLLLRCLPDAATPSVLRCQKALPKGSDCELSPTGGDPCASPNACIDSQCTPSRLLGRPCSPWVSCLEGECKLLGTSNTGVCTLLESKASCFSDFSCASGKCVEAEVTQNAALVCASVCG